MTQTKRDMWDEKFTKGLPSLTVPDPFFLFALRNFIEPAFPRAGSALDIAGGLGRHSLPLADRGWRVIVIDLSTVALDNLKASAGTAEERLEVICADASTAIREIETFDLILLFYHFEWRLLPKIVQALKPGGLLICKLRILWKDEPPSQSGEDIPSLDDVLRLFPDLHVLHRETRRLVYRGVVELIAKKLP